MALILKFPRASHSAQPDGDIVRLLEDLLKRARDGEVQSIVVIAGGPDGHPECAMRLDRGHAVAVIGALCVATRKVDAAIASVIDDADEA